MSDDSKSSSRTPSGWPGGLRPWLLTPRRTPRRGAVGGVGAVLFDRDGTLIEDVPYNADPALVRPRPQAHAALDALRARGIPIGVVTNQSGVAHGRVPPRAVLAIRQRVEALLGPIDVWAVCPHAPTDGCRCRKPAPGLVHAACAALGVPPERTVVVGDIESDLAAARAAGARGVLVPAPATRPAEVDAADAWAPTPLAAVHTLLAGAAPDADPAGPHPAGDAVASTPPASAGTGHAAVAAAPWPPVPTPPTPAPGAARPTGRFQP